LTPGESVSSVPLARAATGAAATLPAHLCDTRVHDARVLVLGITGTRWTTTMTRRRKLMMTMMTQMSEVEVGKVGDMVAEVGEGSGRGGTSGDKKYIIT